jgi:cytochrome c biogenesis protein CcmG, thiol:disulfide interchange protein DsbE
MARLDNRIRTRLLRVGGGVLGGLAVCAIALAVWSALGTSSPTSGTIAAPALGRDAPAPDFTLPRLGGGEPVTISAFKGKPVVLNFFASWCSDCTAELKAFATASRALSGKVDFLGVDSTDSSPATALSLLRAAGDSYPVGVDGYGQVMFRYLVIGLPETFFVDASGKVVGEATGSQSAEQLEQGAALAERS